MLFRSCEDICPRHLHSPAVACPSPHPPPPPAKWPCSVPRPFAPPFCLQPVPRSLSVPGCRPPLFPPRICVPTYLPPHVNFRLLSSPGVWFHYPRVAFFACEDICPRHLHSPAVACPSPHPPPPPLNGPASDIQAPRLPPPGPLPPSPYAILIPSSRLKLVGSSASCLQI